MRVTHLRQQGQPMAVANNRDNQWLLQGKVLIAAGVVTLIVLAAMSAANSYTHSQNRKIKLITCNREFSYYQDAANKNGASASDQYCLAEMLKSGSGTQQSLSEARKWYKKAYDQGLRLAAGPLCDPDMYEYKWKTVADFEKHRAIFEDYHLQFANICCKLPPEGTTAIPPPCPWQEAGRGAE